MVQSQAGSEGFLEHKSDKQTFSVTERKYFTLFLLLVVEQQRERRWEGFGLDVEPQETYGEMNLQH